MLTAIGRVAVQRLVIRAAPSSTLCRAAPIASRIPARTFTTTHWARLPVNKADEGAEKPVKKTTKSATKKAVTKKAAPKKKKAAAKPKPKKVKKAKKEVAPEVKLAQEVRELKKIALLKEPKKLPETVWTLYTTQNIKSGEASLGERSKQLAEEYRLLDAAETERLKDLAEKNKVANNAAYKAWVESHTPAEIVAANNARNVLRRKVNKGRGVTHRFPIRDERLPKRPTTVYNLFFKARWASGDFSGSVTEATRTIAEEYKQLSEEQRQVYEDLATADFERYAREVSSVLNKEVKRKSASPSA
ncbi:Non-histone protein 10 like [Verticillium longisporum]|nr:Non-histone protein 10 like [Verticillium longisporum]